MTAATVPPRSRRHRAARIVFFTIVALIAMPVTLVMLMASLAADRR